MEQPFAIITFRNTGPIKTWSDMRAANVHNSRTKPIEHGIVGAPAPQHLIGTGDLVADVKRQLRGAKINPDRLRKNGVIAYEAILSASPEFFERGSADERGERLEAWTKAQVDWASERYKPFRIASMVLHVDEKTPHIHLVVLPLEVKSDKRRKDTDVRWSLVGRTISGPGRFDEVQDAYAAAMAPFGLQRGIKGSGRKHEPVPVYLARMAAKEREADDLRVALIRDRGEADADRARVLAALREVERRSREVDARAAQIEREDVTRRQRFDREREVWQFSIDEDRRHLDRREKEIDAAEAALAAGEADLASRQASFGRFRDELVATREKLVPIVEAAREFVDRASGMRAEDIVPAARPVIIAAHKVVEACRAPQPAVAAPPPQAGMGW